MWRKIGLFLLLINTIMWLQGCAVVALGGGATIASVATDRRTVGTQLDDTNAEGAIVFRWSKNAELKETAKLNVDVYNGVALLTGQVPSAALAAEAEDIAKGVSHIRKVHNQLRVGPILSAGTQANDIWLANKIRAKILADKVVPSGQIQVIVEDAEVFLIGRLNNLEATTAVEIARQTKGVARVIRAFELM